MNVRNLCQHIVVIQLGHFLSVVSAGYVALMDAETEGSKDGSHSHTVCLAYQPKFSEIPPTAEKAYPLPLVDLSKTLGCSPSDFSHPPRNLSGSAVAVLRGNCTFSRKADLAQTANVSSILIIDYKNSTHLPTPSGNGTKDYDEINITVASVAWEDYQEVIALPAPVEVKIYAIKTSHFDPNMIIILLGSTLIVVVGAICSAVAERKKLVSALTRERSSVEDSAHSSSTGSQKENQVVEITPVIVLFWVVFLVAILLLLYFFYDYTVYFFIAIFCLAGSHGLYSCLLPIWTVLFPVHLELPQSCLSFFRIKSKVKVMNLLLLILCFSVGVFWAIQRHASYAWIFQDILGTAFCISLLKSLRLPSLKIITLVMVLLFCYDVFFVFITPLFTKDGESIMVDVATGGKGQHREMIPLVFLIPLLANSPATLCIERSFSILGFGDVVLPGLLITYNAVFDVHMKSKMVYLITSSIGYLVGMAGCLVALVFMESGQPALFYLVPATLIPTYIVALKRRELRGIWMGEMKTKSQSVNDVNPDSLESVSDEVFDDSHDEEQSPLMN